MGLWHEDGGAMEVCDEGIGPQLCPVLLSRQLATVPSAGSETVGTHELESPKVLLMFLIRV